MIEMRYEIEGNNIEAFIDFTNVHFVVKNVVQHKNKKINDTKVHITSYKLNDVLKALHNGKLKQVSKNTFEIDKRGNDFIFVASVPYSSQVQMRDVKIQDIRARKGKLPVSHIVKREIPVYNIKDEVAIIEAKKEQLPVTVTFYVKEKIWQHELETKIVTVQLKGYTKNGSLDEECKDLEPVESQEREEER
jgi:hypothetical protein